MKFLYLITIAFLVVAFGCTSRKKILNSWIGSTKQNLIYSWGPPARTESDGDGGEILIYARQIYIPQYRMNYWDYKMMYCHKDGEIYHWVTSRQNIPPTEVVVSFN